MLLRFTCLASVLLAAPTIAAAGDFCPRAYEKDVISLDWNPAFLHVDEYDDGAGGTTQGLTISSFFNVMITGGNPPIVPLYRDLVARIADLDAPSLVVEELTDLAPGFPKTVWPNEVVRAPDGMFPFEALVVPQGFHPAPFPGRLTVINLSDPARGEYIVHQSTQASGGPTFPPGDPANSPAFYHKALFLDMNDDGLLDIVTVRSGFRVAPFYPPTGDLVYFINPGTALDPNTPWQEVVLYGGFAANFGGPDIHLVAHDFERDGVPEIVATHFFTGAPVAPGGPPPMNGKISIYGAPIGGTWADVNAAMFALPRVADISTDQGFPFGIEIADLNNDGDADILATNHQPDNCTPMTSSPVPGRVFALETPVTGDLFNDVWTTHVLLDDIRPNPSTQPVQAPGRLAPGSAQAFHPLRALEGVLKPHIVVGGDEASKVWVLRPKHPLNPHSWDYDAAVLFDINEFYGPNATQTPLPDRGVTISTIGGVAVRYDRAHLFGLAEIYVPVFEGHDIHVFSYRRTWGARRVQCPQDVTLSCPAP